MKQTEVGLVPDDWETITFGDKVDILRGGSPRPIENYLTQNANGVNWIKIGDVNPNDKYINKTEERIITEGKKHSREVKKGDFILSNSMSFGRPYILNIDGCIHDGWLTIQNYSESFDKEYLYYLLSSEQVFYQYKTMAAGSSVQNLNKEKVADLKLQLPPLNEQKRIAETLSDIDSLICGIEEEIEKKKNIKTGAMQELLTGKRRLPGFAKSDKTKMTELGEIPEDWEVKELGNLYNMKAGGDVLNKHFSSYFSDKYKYKIFSNGLENEGIYGYTDFPRYKGNAITITGRGTVGIAMYRKEDFDAVIRLLVLNPKNEKLIDNFFITAQINTFVNFANESTGVPQLTVPQIETVEVAFPTKEEQIAIARILSDMDEEINKIEEKLAKYQKIKNAMMQQLLTGKIRFN